MTYLVIVNKTPDNKIAKMQEYSTREEADAHVVRVASSYPNAFVVDNPLAYHLDYTTVDVVAKTITYDSTTYVSDKTLSEWQDSMQATDSSCPRWFEDYVTENSVALANGKAKDSYDAKVQLRSEKP
mgnify:CR=1 FL=1